MRITKSRFVIGLSGLVVLMPGVRWLPYKPRSFNGQASTLTKNNPRNPSVALALDHVDFDRLDFNSHPFEPFNGGLDICALTLPLQGNDADFICYTCPAPGCKDLVLFVPIPNHRRGG